MSSLLRNSTLETVFRPSPKCVTLPADAYWAVLVHVPRSGKETLQNWASVGLGCRSKPPPPPDAYWAVLVHVPHSGKETLQNWASVGLGCRSKPPPTDPTRHPLPSTKSGVATANQTKERSVHELFAGAFRNKSSM